MLKRLRFDILSQPDNTTCGPTCLHAVYRYHGDDIALPSVVDEVQTLEGGGTLGVIMGNHALARGYEATLYTYNLTVFDPTWFGPGERRDLIIDKLRRQAEVKHDAKLRLATHAYIEFLERGGRLEFVDLTAGLIRRYLNRDIPVLVGLSATYLYGCSREHGPDCELDDVRGEPSGHFVVLCGYNKLTRDVLVADPLSPNPLQLDHVYEVPMSRVIAAILLGVLTYDGNLLVIAPKADARHRSARPSVA